MVWIIPAPWGGRKGIDERGKPKKSQFVSQRSRGLLALVGWELLRG